MTPDLHEAARFLQLLDPTATTFHFRVIPEAPDTKRQRPRNIIGAFDDVADDLVQANEDGCGIFLCTQRMGGSGSKATNLAGIRCCWIDVDGRSNQKLPARWLHPSKRGKCPPQIIVETSPGSFQCWWLVDDEPGRETWDGLQRRLVQDFKTDPAGNTDVAKVLRLPGFAHRKREPHLVRMVVSGRGRYSVVDMAAVYTPVAVPQKPKKSQVREQPATKQDFEMVQRALVHLASVPHPDVQRIAERNGGPVSTSYADDYETWFKFGLAMYRAFADDGFDAWHKWSASSAAYPGPEVCERKWKSFEQAVHKTPVTIGSIFYAATKNGWSRPSVPKPASPLFARAFRQSQTLRR